MTDRHAAYLVTLGESLREDDAQNVVTALEQIRGVVSVMPLNDNAGVMIATERARVEIRAKVFEALDQATRRPE